jgi:hypothetical protein
MLFHHRYPTSTINVKRAAHPFNTGDFFGKTRYVLAHNGVVRNPKELRKKHEEMGIKYQSVLHDDTFNDSEALLWDFALTMEGKQDKLKAYGGIAFICMRMTDGKLDRLYFGRNSGRPLNLKRTKESVALSSEGEGEEIEEKQLYTFNYELNRLTTKYFNIPSFDPEYVSNYTYTGRKYVPAATNRGTYGSYSSGYRTSGAWGGSHWENWDDDDDYGIPYSVWDSKTQQWVDNPLRASARSYDTLIDRVARVITTERERNALFWKLISQCDGNYESAYWTAQGEYYALEAKGNENLTQPQVRQMALYNEVSEMISDDPMNVDSNSVHSLWMLGTETKSTFERALLSQGAN